MLSTFVWELYTIFNKIVKATYIRSRAAYRLKIIARARSTDNKPSGLIHTRYNVIAKSLSLTSLTTGFFISARIRAVTLGSNFTARIF